MSVGRSVQKKIFREKFFREVAFGDVVFFFFFFFDRPKDLPQFLFQKSQVPLTLFPGQGEGHWDLRAKRVGRYPDRGNASYGSGRLGSLYNILSKFIPLSVF